LKKDKKLTRDAYQIISDDNNKWLKKHRTKFSQENGVVIDFNELDEYINVKKMAGMGEE